MDWTNLRKLREMEQPGPPTETRRLIALFVESAPERVDSLRGALQDGDREAAAQAAHTLRGSCASFGAVELAEAAGRFEEALERGAPAEEAAGLAEAVSAALAGALADLADPPTELAG